MTAVRDDLHLEVPVAPNRSKPSKNKPWHIPGHIIPLMCPLGTVTPKRIVIGSGRGPVRQLTHRGCCKGLFRIGAVAKVSPAPGRVWRGWRGGYSCSDPTEPDNEEKYVFMGGLNFTFFVQLFMYSLIKHSLHPLLFWPFASDESCCLVALISL